MVTFLIIAALFLWFIYEMTHAFKEQPQPPVQIHRVGSGDTLVPLDTGEYRVIRS